MRKEAVIMASVLTLVGCRQKTETPVSIYIGTYGGNLYETTYTPGTEGNGFSELIPTASENPSYLALADDGTLFAVNECGASSAISSFRSGVRTGHSTEIGDDPCYVTVHGNMVITANYTGGSMSVFQTDESGAITPVQTFMYYDGSGVVPGRQESAHIHQTRFIPELIADAEGIHGEWILASDLGCDSIHLYKVQHGSQDPCTEYPGIGCGAGSGPRHMEFDCRTGMLYCITELSGEVISWKISASKDGTPLFTEKQRIKADMVDAGGSADIHLSADGRFLYTSHRLRNDGISTFKVGNDGTLTRAGYTQTGTHPRNFLLLPDGKAMLVAVRDSHQIEVYSIDQETGIPSVTDQVLKFPAGNDPVCMIIRTDVTASKYKEVIADNADPLGAYLFGFFVHHFYISRSSTSKGPKE